MPSTSPVTLPERPRARRSVRRAPSPGPAPPSRHDLVGRLLDGTCHLADLPRLADLLRVPVRGAFTVVVVRGGTPRDRAAARACVLAPVRWHTAPGGDHGIVVVGGPGDPVRADALPPGVRVGVGLGADGLAAVPQDRRRADLALDLTPAASGVARLGDHLVPALVAADRDLAGIVVDRVLGPLLAHPAEASVLLATLAAWLDADGSATVAAGTLGCHRNTVTNRLRRVERLTGRRVDRPRDVVVLGLAMAGLAGTVPAGGARRPRPATRRQAAAPPGPARRAAS